MRKFMSSCQLHWSLKLIFRHDRHYHMVEIPHCVVFRLGAWQFMADMPYKAVTLPTLWQILWILYNYQSTNSQSASDHLTNNFQIPQSVDEILTSIKGENSPLSMFHLH